MELRDFQKLAMSTCMPSCENVNYMVVNLIGEVGELSEKLTDITEDYGTWMNLQAAAIQGEQASKLGKRIRSGEAKVTLIDVNDIKPEQRSLLMKEAGDVLWQLSGFCAMMGWDLEDVARMNLSKLADRKERGKIEGNGDER